MSHEGQENQGTGLREVFDILLKEPPERLLSLTIQLGEAPEDIIIHALCLIILQKEAQALDKLQMLTDNYLANHLAQRWQMSGGKLEDFRVQCGHFQESTLESLAALARIFKVLSEQRLCDPDQRNLAYRRALSTDSQKTSSGEYLEYDPLREEAKVVCGPHFEEWICSTGELKSGSYHDPDRSLDEANPTLKITDPSQRACLPSPLQASSSMPSYPTHLEVSIPPTMSFQGDKITPETSDKSNTCVPPAPEQPLSSEEPQPNEPAKLEVRKDSKMDAAVKLDHHIIQNESPNQTTKPSTEPKCVVPTATNTCVPKAPAPDEMHECEGAEAEEEEFYAFVILHAPEDANVAESMKEKLERVAGCTGATFSDDFAIPGKSTLRCVEDAINNSAYTLLLFTRNFNTEWVEMKTDTALVNSINKKYKHNTVIPLLPRENCMPREGIPMILRPIIPLDESKNFEKKIKRFLSPTNIETQKRIWTEGQKVKLQIERQEKLKQLNQCKKQLIQECNKAELQHIENLNLSLRQNLHLGPGVPLQLDGGDGMARWPQQQGSIHIENANYVMIGNESKMNVDHRGLTDKDDSRSSEEEQ
uniref:TIR domain-containing adaptor inducing interferon-Beta n=1 Tax=Trachinotus ovatus TaxID=173339 RepID=A0A4P9Q2J9_TRAOV|nr:TIR domain-containing adaptor inducing interferon-Beta [Trachinotus ovatus]